METYKSLTCPNLMEEAGGLDRNSFVLLGKKLARLAMFLSMESIGFGEVIVKDIPILKNDWKNIVEGEYILLAPFASAWEEKKRSWEYKKFVELSNLLENQWDTKCVILKKYHYSFSEMISLIKHCRFFIGNDSGPAIIAQSFKKKAFIIFGGTRPDYIHMSKHTVPIYDRNRHKLCKHNSKKEELDCCEEFCMERISVDKVFDQIRLMYE